MLNMQQTLSLIKPDATKRHITGAINAILEREGFEIVAQKRIHLTYHQATIFYSDHKEKGFFDSLCRSIASGPLVAQILQGENAIQRYRVLMGHTDPSQATPGTLRQEFGQDIENNTVHGSDSLQNAQIEIGFFFSRLDILHAL